MSYIGRKPTVGNFQICDAISVVNGQAAYTMQVGSVNVLPETANHMIVSLNGVIQKPNSSYTVAGAVITFSSNLVTGDVINFIQILGSVLDVGTVSDATITNAKTNFVSTSSAAGLQIKGDGTTDGTLQLNCSQNSHGIKIKSPPHSAGASYTLTMPNNDGDANQVLTTNGSGVLTWSAVSSDFVKISTTTVSSATSSASLTGINSTYMNYVIKANDIAQASTGTNLRFRYINSSGDITSSSYYGIGDGAYKPYNSADAILRFSLYNTNYGQVTNFNGSSNTGYTSSFEMNLPNPSNANTMPSCYGQNLTDGENGTYLITSIFSFKQTAANTAVTGIKFYFDGVNITQGNFTLYGIKG